VQKFVQDLQELQQLPTLQQKQEFARAAGAAGVAAAARIRVWIRIGLSVGLHTFIMQRLNFVTE
jgi:hypothetical protein